MRLAHKNAVEASITEQTYTITKRPRAEENDPEDVDEEYRSENDCSRLDRCFFLLELIAR